MNRDVWDGNCLWLAHRYLWQGAREPLDERVVRFLRTFEAEEAARNARSGLGPSDDAALDHRFKEAFENFMEETYPSKGKGKGKGRDESDGEDASGGSGKGKGKGSKSEGSGESEQGQGGCDELEGEAAARSTGFRCC